MNKFRGKKTRKLSIFLLLLCLVTMLGASLWIALKNGISLDRIKFSSVTAKQIFIQADDGIILSVDRLDVLAGETTDSLSRPELFIAPFNEWAHLFREIRINQINHKDQSYTLLFKDNKFTVSGDSFLLASTLTYADGEVRLNISQLETKPYPVTLAGKAVYLQEQKRLNFTGGFSGADISGQLTFSQLPNLVVAEISTDRFTNLPGLLAQLPVDPEVVSWVEENITVQDYRVEQLKLEATLQDGIPDIQPTSISGNAIATNAAIRFHPSLPPVQSALIHISYDNDRLSFDLEEPIYKTKNLSGSGVEIAPLIGKNTQLAINIQTETPLDNEIHKLLGTYDIRIPFTQHDGTTLADLNLIFNLPEFTLRSEGKFITGKGNWTLGDIAFRTEDAEVLLKDDLVFINNAEILYQDTLQARIMGVLNTAEQQAELTAEIKQFDFQDGEYEIVMIRDLTTPININYKKDDVYIDLLTLKTTISVNPTRNILSLSDLNSVKSYIPFLDTIPLDEGNVSIIFTDPNNLTFDGFINTSVFPLLSEGEPITHFTFQGTRAADGLNATLNNGKISLALSDKLIIHLHDYQVTANIDKIGEKKSSAVPLPVFISGPGILIKSKRLSIPTKNFLGELTGEHTNFTADLDQGRILFESDGEDMSLTASEIDALIAQEFFPFTDLEGGKFNLSLTGKDYKTFVGVVEFNNVLIREGVILNNVLSFINAVPALATLSSPGFDSNGYQVNKGVAYFSNNNDLLTIHQFHTDGKTINGEAEGWVNLENKTLQMNIKLISLKDYSKIINILPWIGYVILGEDGSISTSLDISGNLEEPEISTNLTKEIIILPFNMVKRTIKWPFSLFDKMKELQSQQPEQTEEDYIFKNNGH